MKKVIVRVLPARTLRTAKILRRKSRLFASKIQTFTESFRDARRYVTYATPPDGLGGPKLSGRQLECQLTKDYHRVEKGLSLATPRQPFGAEVQKRLNVLIPRAVSTSPNEQFVQYSEDADRALRGWNSTGARGDIATVESTKLPEFAMDSDARVSFFSSRRSVRNFDLSVPITIAQLEEATMLAGLSPSVCNRQPWHVRYYLGNDQAKRVLVNQNGNAGFRDSVPCVAVVSVDSRLFAGASERHQPWVDGGIFSMALVTALHSMGLQTCMLNLSLTNDKLSQLRAATEMEDSDLPIMMIAIGVGAEDHLVARSPRRPTDDISQIIF